MWSARPLWMTNELATSEKALQFRTVQLISVRGLAIYTTGNYQANANKDGKNLDIYLVSTQWRTLCNLISNAPCYLAHLDIFKMVIPILGDVRMQISLMLLHFAEMILACGFITSFYLIHVMALPVSFRVTSLSWMILSDCPDTGEVIVNNVALIVQ